MWEPALFNVYRRVKLAGTLRFPASPSVLLRVGDQLTGWLVWLKAAGPTGGVEKPVSNKRREDEDVFMSALVIKVETLLARWRRWKQQKGRGVSVLTCERRPLICVVIPCG